MKTKPYFSVSKRDLICNFLKRPRNWLELQETLISYKIKLICALLNTHLFTNAIVDVYSVFLLFSVLKMCVCVCVCVNQLHHKTSNVHQRSKSDI